MQPNLNKIKSLKKTHALSNTTFEIKLFRDLRSVDVPWAEFRNFVKIEDSKIISQVKIIKELESKLVPSSQLPFKLPDDERSYFLLNDQNDMGREIRFKKIREVVGFNHDLVDVIKYEFDKRDSHRIFAIKSQNVIELLFLDPFHHVAYSKEARERLNNPYEKCKDRLIDIKDIK